MNITDCSIEKEDKVIVKVDKYKNISLNAIPYMYIQISGIYLDL